MHAPSPLHLLLIDDHSLLRAGLRLVLEQGLPHAMIREAGSIAQAIAENQVRPHAVLLDIEMPGLSGMEGLAVFRRRWPGAPVIILTSHDDVDTRAEALAKGAAAFLSKAEPTDRIVATVEGALRGEMPPSEVAHSAARSQAQLTPRQYEVLDQLGRGYSNKVIGRHLNLSENTVRVHVQALLAAFNVASRAEAVAVARERGLMR
ncbi:response regulator [Labrys neptuniae]